MPDAAPLPPTALQIFALCSRIGLTSFGGGVSGWMLREVVQRHRWMDEEAFLNGLSLSQALPGVNVTNLALWVGYRLRGLPGALAGLCGIVVPPAVLIVALAAMVETLDRFSLTRPALDGAAAAAIGLSLSMGLTLARRVPRRLLPWLVMTATFAAVALLHWPLVWVVLAAGALSVGLEFRRLGRP